MLESGTRTMSWLERAAKSSTFQILIPVVSFVTLNILFVANIVGDIRLNQIVGMSIANCGLLIWLVARLQFNNAPLHERPVTRGLYGRLRHPVYYSALLTLVGVVVFVWQLYAIPLVVALMALQAVRITKAELTLRQQFGEQYKRHRQRTWF